MWNRIAAFLTAGYLAMSRSFSYFGFPAANVYIGEAVLAAFALGRRRALFGRWFHSLWVSGPFLWTAWSLLAFMAYGLVELARGLAAGHSTLPCLQNLVFNYYPLYLFVGLSVAWRDKTRLQKVVRCVAWTNGIYGVLYILILNQVSLTIPGSPDVRLLGQPAGSAVALAGLLSFEKRLTRVALPLLLNAFTLVGLQVRAEWLGFVMGLVTWGLLMLRPWKVIAGVALVAGLLFLGYCADFSLPAPTGRTGVISVNEVVGRVIAPFDMDLASSYSDNAHIYAGTFQWRTKWWIAIWDSVHEDSTVALAGHGYGYPLADLVPNLRGRGIRTPHSVFYYALGYGGWIGVALFVTFQISLLVLQWRACRLSGNPFGIILQTMSVAAALFSNFFETPFGAIPFYLLLGMAAAPVFQRRETVYAHSPRSLPVPAAGW